ncbi:MAG: hypothetical protein J5518_11415 [Lachnospiraceae bacterium]|nr:hypothetical protein [Lachnospiraceae bacterium]
MKEKKTSRVLTGILIGFGVGAIAVTGAIIVLFYFFFAGGPIQTTDNVELYEETMHKYTNEVVGKVHTGFFSFPQTIPESAFANDHKPEFYFSYRDTWDDPTCEVYLKCTYSDTDYAKETDRLKNSEFELGDDDLKVIKHLEYEEGKRFMHPVYKAIDCDDHSYEYAMDLGNNEIVYIYTSFKDDPRSLKRIPKEYLPDDYSASLMKNTFANGGFNVYVTEKTDAYRRFDYGDKFN